MSYRYKYKPQTINPNVHVGDLVRVNSNYFIKGYRDQVGEVVQVTQCYLWVKFTGVPKHYRAHADNVNFYGAHRGLEIAKGSVEVVLSS